VSDFFDLYFFSVLRNVARVKAREVCDAEEIARLWMMNCVPSKTNPITKSLAILRNVNLKMIISNGLLHLLAQ
jgi:hypothetical protein